MAGRQRNVRRIQSYINNSDTHSGIGPIKQGTPPKTGVTRYYWHNLQTQANPNNRHNFEILTGIGKYVGFGNLIWLGIKPPPYKTSPHNTFIHKLV